MIFICMYIFKDFGLFWNIFFVKMRIHQKIFFTAFSKEEFSSWLEKVVPATIILGAVSLGYVILSSLFRLYEIKQSISCCSNKIILKISTPGQYFLKKLSFIVQNMKIRIPTKSIVWILDMNQYIKLKCSLLTAKAGIPVIVWLLSCSLFHNFVKSKII